MIPAIRGAWLTVLLLLGSAAGVAAQLAPDARWRTFETEHFRVHFAEGLHDLARAAAVRAERAHALLAAEFLPPPAGRIDLLVADDVDFANGFATPFPRNRIVVFAHPPTDTRSLGFFDDWMELVVTHELVHIFHLDHAAGPWRPLRGLFGRVPLLFPQILQPAWLVEGLATYYESRLTDAGRVRGSLHEMMLRTAVLEDGFFGVDRATGDPLAWPGAPTRYVYGSMFVDHLARRFGPDAATRLVERMGGRLVPYRLDAAARDVYGVSVTAAWGAWRDSLTQRYTVLADSLRAQGLTQPEIVADGGGHAESPRHAPDGSIVFAADTRADRPALRLLPPDGAARTLARLNTLGSAAWLPGGEGVLIGQLEYRDPYRIHADLYRVDRDGRRRRLTHGARIWDADPHPAGAAAVAVRSEPGTNALVRVDLDDGAVRPLLAPQPDVHWAAPRWSPDGTRIAAARWRTGGFFDIVVLDSAGALLRELTADRAVDAAPAWSPDGRWVLFDSDRTGIPNLYAYDLESGRLLQATNVLTGAFAPDVSPDGRSVVFSLYGADGYRIARIPFEPERWPVAPPVRAAVAAADPARFDTLRTATAGGPDRPYSPLPTLAPTSWLPRFGVPGLGWGLGAQTGGADVVERHSWSLDATYHPPARRLDAGLAYRYAGLGVPLLDGWLAQRWSVAAEANTIGAPGGGTVPSAVLQRDRRVDVGLTLLRPRLSASTWLRAGALLEENRFAWTRPSAADGLALRQPPVQAGGSVEAGVSTVRAFALSIGAQEGASLSARAQALRDLRGADGEGPLGYARYSARGRGYRGFGAGGGPRHVVAARLDAALDVGSGAPGLTLGGVGSGGVPLPLGFELLGRRVGFPLRGYPEGAQRGNRVVMGSLEYRVPISLVERGVGVLPLYFSRVWGDVFVDAGSAWCVADCGRAVLPGDAVPFRPLVSIGAESVFEARVGYFADLMLRAGLAVPLRSVPVEGGQRRPAPQLYLGFGPTF